MQNYFFLSFSVFFAALSAVNASSYSIQLFSDSNCEDLLAEDSGTFATNGCISQSGVNSIRITSLDNAMIHTWVSKAPASYTNVLLNLVFAHVLSRRTVNAITMNGPCQLAVLGETRASRLQAPSRLGSKLDVFEDSLRLNVYLPFLI